MNKVHLANFRAIVIGCSSGGIKALEQILPPLPAHFKCPLFIVQHISPAPSNYLASLLDRQCQIKVMEAQEQQCIECGTAYVAPSNYHLLIESGEMLTLCASERVSYTRPSVDMLFMSAADVYGKELLALVLTGANDDGTAGAAYIQRLGGTVIIQDPASAEAKTMPRSVLLGGFADYILSLEEMVNFLTEIER